MAVQFHKKIPPALLWAVAAILILGLGAGSAYYFSTSQGVNPVAGLWDTLFKSDSKPQIKQKISGQKGPVIPGEHVVQEGENLWAIIRKGKLLNNPWQWKQVVDQNRGKIDSVMYSDVTGDWTVLIETGTELRVEPKDSTPATGKAPKKYALQVLSVPPEESQRAFDTAKAILKSGHFAYLVRTKVEGQEFLRVRIGFFDNKPAANNWGRRLKRDMGVHLPNEPILVIPEDGEVLGKSMVFGVQRYRPWAVELRSLESHQQALKALADVNDEGEFAYIAQKREAPSGIFTYSVRLGYFISKKDAQTFLEKMGTSGIWEGARPRALMGFKEALPGQRIMMGR